MKVVCHRSASPDQSRIYLTFDDGPEPGDTEEVLDVLRKHDAKATFFVVAERALRHQKLLKAILADGHAIGNHSLDHRYTAFFGGKARMIEWIRSSEKLLQSLTGAPSVGWRSPAGIKTPPLYKALGELELPLIHWNTRFYDAVHPLTWTKAERTLERITPGSIILLHDKQKKEHKAVFLSSLNRFIAELKARGLQPARLDRALLQGQG